MRCRQDQQRYIRQTIRAQAFVKQYPNFVVSETRVSGFFPAKQMGNSSRPKESHVPNRHAAEREKQATTKAAF